MHLISVFEGYLCSNHLYFHLNQQFQRRLPTFLNQLFALLLLFNSI